MRFFTALITLAIASVELGVLAAPAVQPNVNGLSAVSKNAVVKPKAAQIASTKTAKRKTRRATVNNAVAPPPAALGPISTDEMVTVIVHQLSSDGRDPDDDGQDGDDDAGDANAGDSDEVGGDDEAGDDEAGDDEAGDDEAGDDEAGDDEAGDDEAGDDDNDNDDDP